MTGAERIFDADLPKCDDDYVDAAGDTGSPSPALGRCRRLLCNMAGAERPAFRAGNCGRGALTP